MTAAPDYTKPDPGSSEAVADAFALLWRAVGLLSEDIPAHLDADQTADEAVVTLDSLTRAWRELGEIKAYAESVCVQRLRYGRNEVAGFVAEVKGGRKRTEWESDRLAWDVVAEFTVDPNGVPDAERAEIVGKVRDRLLNCARPDWRMTPLRDLGLDPDDYCHTEPGRKSVIISPATDEKAAS